MNAKMFWPWVGLMLSCKKVLMPNCMHAFHVVKIMLNYNVNTLVMKRVSELLLDNMSE